MSTHEADYKKFLKNMERAIAEDRYLPLASREQMDLFAIQEAPTEKRVCKHLWKRLGEVFK